MYLPLISELTLILGSALVGGIISRRLKLPIVTGYLLVGILASALLQNKLGAGDVVPALADIGVALLLFSVGTEFSFSKVSRSTKYSALGAVAQVLLTTLLGFLIFPRLFGLDVLNSLILSFAVSMSSTSVVLKVLSDTEESRTLHGELMSGWLISQDLLVVPVVALLPLLGASGGGVREVLIFVLKVVFAVYLILLLGRRLVPLLFEKIATLSSKELMLVASFAVSLALGHITQNILGSFALGAFLGGVVLSSSLLKCDINVHVRSVRDLFVAIFFVSIGFIFNPSFLLTGWWKILVLTILVLLLKFIIIFPIVRYLGFHTRVSFLVAVGLVEIGEFAFVLARVGIGQNILTQDTYQLLVSVTILSLLLTPLLLNKSKALYKSVREFTRRRARRLDSVIFGGYERSITSFDDASPGLFDHVVLVGFGRVGRIVAEVLRLSKVSYVVIDEDYKTLEPLIGRDTPFIYGDAEEDDILKLSEIEKARLLVLAIPDTLASEQIIRRAKTLNSSIKVVARAHSVDDVLTLSSLGVKDVIEPEFEASISISELVLDELFKDQRKSRRVLSEIIKEHVNGQ